MVMWAIIFAVVYSDKNNGTFSRPDRCIAEWTETEWYWPELYYLQQLYIWGLLDWCPAYGEERIPDVYRI